MSVEQFKTHAFENKRKKKHIFCHQNVKIKKKHPYISDKSIITIAIVIIVIVGRIGGEQK